MAAALSLHQPPLSRHVTGGRKRIPDPRPADGAPLDCAGATGPRPRRQGREVRAEAPRPRPVRHQRRPTTTPCQTSRPRRSARNVEHVGRLGEDMSLGLVHPELNGSLELEAVR